MTADLPAGIESHLVANQPEVVEEAVGEFIKTLIEAIVIVLAVSFLSLGWRPRKRTEESFGRFPRSTTGYSTTPAAVLRYYPRGR